MDNKDGSTLYANQGLVNLSQLRTTDRTNDDQICVDALMKLVGKCFLRDGYMLDAFGSDVGSTLDDLATDWENVSELDETTASMDEIGKRMAKPLYFFNPVFSMFYKDVPKGMTQRQTFIPISQPNETNNSSEKKSSVSYEKRKHGSHNHHHGHGILSKLAGIGRRHSKSKLLDPPVLSQPPHDEQTNRADSTSRKEHPQLHRNSASPAKSSAQDVPAPKADEPSPSRENSAENDTKRTSVHASPSQNDESASIVVSSAQEKPAEDHVDAGSDDRGLPTPVKSTPGGSFSSTQSDDSVISDGPVTTMADVISEMTQEEETIDRETETATEIASNDTEPSEEEPPLLKRNKTLKWSGTRKAPALIREFTRRQKRQARQDEDTESANNEVEAALLSNKMMSESNRPRSCTPSQQTTSFGMEDDRTHSSPERSPKTSPSKPNKEKVEEPAKNEQPASPGGSKSTPRKTSNGSNSKRDSAFIVLSSFLPPAPRLRRSHSSKVRAYLQKMGGNPNTALGYAVSQFVQLTIQNKESRPLVLLHDVRSFLTDIKRYLISNPHLGVVKKIQKIVNNSSSIDVEGAVDDALDKLVLYPLHNSIYRCLVVNYIKSGQMKLMEDAITLAKSKTNQELGIRSTLIPPDADSLEVIKGHFTQVQKTYSPYFKLKELLIAVTKIYESTHDLNTEDKSARKIGADDFLPLLVHSIVNCNFVAGDIEAQYIDGLLDPNLLLGEGGYYLTTLISAVQVVLSIKRREAALPNISDLQGFLKVGISSMRRKGSVQLSAKPGSDENEEVVFHKTLHVPPAMTSYSLCQMITRKFRISMPQEYCLHVIVRGTPYPLEPTECPQLVKMDLLTQIPASAFYFSFQRKNKNSTPKRPSSIATKSTDAVTALDVENQGEDPESTAVPTNGKAPSESLPDEKLPAVSAILTDDQVVITITEDDQQTGLEINEDVAAVADQASDEVSTITDMMDDNGKPSEKDNDPENEDDGSVSTSCDARETNAHVTSDVDIAPMKTTVILKPPCTDEPGMETSRLPSNIPIISVSDFLFPSANDGAIFDCGASPSKNSSRSSSIGDVFTPCASPHRGSRGRETVASLTEYFETRSVPQSSPTSSPKH